MKKVSATDDAPVTIGPYPQAVQDGGYIYVSGQLPIDPAIGQFTEDDIASQTGQLLISIKSILENEGLSVDNVIGTVVLLNSIAGFGAMSEVHVTFFTDTCPAKTAFEVTALPRVALMEVEATTYCGK